MTDIQNYTGKYSAHYSDDFSLEKELIKIRRNKILESLGNYFPQNVLEIGCGLEPLFLFYKNFKSFTIVEPSPDFVKHAQKLTDGITSINIIEGYFEEMVEDLSQKQNFDYIVLSSLLHEVLDPKKLLQSIYRVCQKDTIIHINVPNVNSFHRLLAYEMGIVESVFAESETEKEFQRHTRFDKERLYNMLAENDFRIIDFDTYFIKPFSHKQMEQIIAQNIVTKNVIDGLEKMIKYMPDLGCEMLVTAKIKHR